MTDNEILQHIEDCRLRRLAMKNARDIYNDWVNEPIGSNIIDPSKLTCLYTISDEKTAEFKNGKFKKEVLKNFELFKKISMIGLDKVKKNMSFTALLDMSLKSPFELEKARREDVEEMNVLRNGKPTISFEYRKDVNTSTGWFTLQPIEDILKENKRLSLFLFKLAYGCG